MVSHSTSVTNGFGRVRRFGYAASTTAITTLTTTMIGTTTMVIVVSF
ncbi:unnamed protein product, partial [Brassica oleracea var. botrytis]